MHKNNRFIPLIALISMLIACGNNNSTNNNNSFLPTSGGTTSLNSSNEENTSKPDVSSSEHQSESDTEEPTEKPSESSSESPNISSSESSSETIQPTPGPGLNEFGLAIDPQDGTILHAFNWSLNQIKEKLPEIQKAGYSSVQTSPMQLPKENARNNWRHDWWKLYQPLNFSIAHENRALGTKSELKSLCDEADKYGIKVIVDVVANHLANRNGGDINPDIRNYEKEIYDQNLFHPFSIGNTNDKTIKNVVQGHLGGLPDLMTENSLVQARVLSLLKEYIDCGVDGFRFDAAKHIETPDDGEYASDFWPTILNGAKSYAAGKGKQLFYYGEILHQAGANRKYSSYQKMMSVTDSTASEDLFYAISNNNLNKAIGDIHSFDIDLNKAVLWGESHDSYSNNDGHTRKADQKTIDKAYAIAASRNDAASLYFPRPSNDSTIGNVKNNCWNSKTIAEINKFHNQFIDTSSATYAIDDIYLNLRQAENGNGLMLVNNNKKQNFSIEFQGLKDGSYKDSISGNNIIISHGVITGTFSDSDIAIIGGEAGKIIPSISASLKDKSYVFNNESVTITSENAELSSLYINGELKDTFKDKIDIYFNEFNPLSTIDIKVESIKNDNTYTKTFQYKVIDAMKGNVICENIPEDISLHYKPFIWSWKAGKDGSWSNCDIYGNSCMFRKIEGDDHFLLAFFEKDITLSQADWQLCKKQTKDFAYGNVNRYDVSNNMK